MTGRKKARHYPAARWVDFVRGLVSGADRSLMQSHLDTGCDKCMQLSQFYAKVAVRAAADAGYHLPHSAVQAAREMYRKKYSQGIPTLGSDVRKAA